MKILFIGDIVGKVGRKMVATHLKKVREAHNIDIVIANAENSAHGFGITERTAKELIGYGVDLITGGNHTWDKKEIVGLFETLPIIRPLNYPDGVAGSGTHLFDNGLAVINLMGFFSMGVIDNPFNAITKEVARVKELGAKAIFIDFHAEATSEKNVLLKMLEGEVSAIAGTHTHVGTDDLLIASGTGYVSDVGLTGIRSEVIGMGSSEPIFRFTTGLKNHFKVLDSGKAIFQAVIFEFDGMRCIDAYKIKAYDNDEPFISMRHGGGW